MDPRSNSTAATMENLTTGHHNATEAQERAGDANEYVSVFLQLFKCK